MLYLATGSSDALRSALAAGLVGRLATPASRNRIEPGVTWAADNGCFSKGYPGDAAYLAWLELEAHAADRCLFATCPDVVADAAATLQRSRPFFAPIRELGYRAALVAQDGSEHIELPWSDFDVLFIGGTTAWKLSSAAADVAARARLHGKPVHMGRVNSGKRLLHAAKIGCSSADGTFLRFAPDANMPRLLAWIDGLDARPLLPWGAA